MIAIHDPPVSHNNCGQFAVLPLFGIFPQIWGYRTHPKELGNNFKNPSKHWEILYQCEMKIFDYFGCIRRLNRVQSICVLQIYNYNLQFIFLAKFVVRNVIVQTVFRIVSAVTILKTISGIEWDIL